MNEQNFRFFSYNQLIFGFSLWICLCSFFILFGFFASQNIAESNQFIIILSCTAITFVSFLVAYTLSKYEVEVSVDAKQNCKIIQGKVMYIFHNDEINLNLNDIKKVSYTSPARAIFKKLKIELTNKRKYTFHSEYFIGSKKLDQFVQFLESPQEQKSITIGKKPEIYSKLWYQILVLVAMLFGIYYLITISIDTDYRFTLKTVIFIIYFLGVLHQLFEIIEVKKKIKIIPHIK